MKGGLILEVRYVMDNMKVSSEAGMGLPPWVQLLIVCSGVKESLGA